eukprot:CAMPEP_0184486962 /NCGR_PEP_ID=MMETSP0113_2-20130426/8829_1 /TAXON_ID=91329 /ORGANISM="Norrisiella sphaerica, Strain BC52" /LENGTH=168 /DNA_ID=CAMNT_0026869057 /DNA_START=47 /DNA_END=553 /DNA_ORIENTATION=-
MRAFSKALGMRKSRFRCLATASSTKAMSAQTGGETARIIQFSSKKLRCSRMVRKMVKEIFGHPNVPAEGEVLKSLPPHNNIIVALVPEDRGLDVERLRLSYPTESIHEDEAGDMMMYTAARVRIDSSLLLYYPHAFEHLLVDKSLRHWDDGHVLFGDFASDDKFPIEP